MARVTGLEPATSGVTGRHSNRLSYTPAGTASGANPVGDGGSFKVPRRRCQAPLDEEFSLCRDRLVDKPAGPMRGEGGEGAGVEPRTGSGAGPGRSPHKGGKNFTMCNSPALGGAASGAVSRLRQNGSRVAER